MTREDLEHATSTDAHDAAMRAELPAYLASTGWRSDGTWWWSPPVAGVSVFAVKVRDANSPMLHDRERAAREIDRAEAGEFGRIMRKAEVKPVRR